MRIATWNINSIRARRDRLLDWLQTARPDVLCLQELKCLDDEFPLAEVQAVGYRAVVNGQKTYNGVAILARSDLENVQMGLRIDYILATQPVVDRCTAADIDRQARKGKLPSDHAPVWAELAD